MVNLSFLVPHRASRALCIDELSDTFSPVTFLSATMGLVPAVFCVQELPWGGLISEHCQSRHVWKPLPALPFLNSCMWVNAAVARCRLFTADKLSQWEHFISSMLEFIKYSLEQWFELTYPCSLLNSGLWSELLSGRSNGSLIVYENMNSFSKRDFHVQKPHNSMVSCSQLSTLTTRLLSIMQAATTASFFLLEHTGALWG